MNTKKRELEAKIEELEADIASLKADLRGVELQEQHDAIDNLDEHLKMLDHKWDNLRVFWPIVLAELRELFAKDKGSKK